MARLPRYGVAGQPQHVIQRGNNRSPIFFAPGDYEFFLECLSDGCAQYSCAIHAYVLALGSGLILRAGNGGR